MINLGKSIVLSANDMKKGQYINMDGTIVAISRVNGPDVVLRPVVGAELLKYKIQNAWTEHPLFRIFCVCVVFVTVGFGIIAYWRLQ